MNINIQMATSSDTQVFGQFATCGVFASDQSVAEITPLTYITSGIFGNDMASSESFSNGFFASGIGD